MSGEQAPSGEDAVRADLRAWADAPLTGDATMPADVAARLDAALLAAGRERPTGPRRTAGASVTALPARPARDRGRRWLAAAAALVLLLGVVGGGAALLSSDGAHRVSSDGAQAALAAPQTAPPVIVAESGGSYANPDELRAGVRDLLARRLRPPGGIPSPTGAAAAAAPVTTPATPPTSVPGPTSTGGRPPGEACLDALAGDGRVVAVDESIRYAGQPAVLGVVEDATGARTAFVLPPDCGGGPDAFLLTLPLPAGR